MSSSSDTSEKSEKRRIWELEEQLEEEQHAHRKTKFTLRDVQEKLDQMSTANNKDQLESLMAENEDLKSALKKLEVKSQTLLSESSTLEESLKKLKNKFAKMESQKESSIADSKREVQVLMKLNRELVENFRLKRDELKNQLKQETEKAKDLRQGYLVLEKLSNEALESMRAVETERAELKIEVQKQCYEARLEEYKDEVNRLKTTKKGVVNGCRMWAQDYRDVVNRLISVLEERAAEEDVEEVKRLREEREKAWDEYCWWDNYRFFTHTLSEAFRAMQEMKSNPITKESLASNREDLECRKRSFENQSTKLKDGQGRKEWVREELASKCFEKWEKLIREAEERVEKS